VRENAFFAPIDWAALYSRNITPPFNPTHNQSELETANFEREFTNMPVSIDASCPIDGINGIDADTGLYGPGMGGMGGMGGGGVEGRDEREDMRDRRLDSDTFLNFTYEEESHLETLIEDLAAARYK
jgi:hypothetical protein